MNTKWKQMSATDVSRSLVAALVRFVLLLEDYTQDPLGDGTTPQAGADIDRESTTPFLE